MRSLLARFARVFSLAAVICGIAGLFAVQRARAYGERMLLSLGDHMMRYAGADNQTTPVELRINGASVFVSNGAVQAPLSAVLDHFHAACTRKNGQLGAQWAEAAARTGQTVSGRGRSALLDGVFRVQNEEQGTVACFETGVERLEPAALLARFEEFMRTGDASAMGHFRYVRAFRGERRTIFVALWSEGPLPLWQMFPADGDAPGSDPEGIDRPNGSRRLLSSQQVGRDELISLYASTRQSPQQLADFYRSSLKARGYSLLAGGGGGPADFLVAHDGKHMLTVALAADPAGHGLATLTSRPD